MLTEDGRLDLSELAVFTKTNFKGLLRNANASSQFGDARVLAVEEIVTAAARAYCKMFGLRLKWYVVAPATLRLVVAESIVESWD